MALSETKYRKRILMRYMYYVMSQNNGESFAPTMKDEGELFDAKQIRFLDRIQNEALMAIQNGQRGFEEW